VYEMQALITMRPSALWHAMTQYVSLERLQLCLLDMKKAFLYGTLQEEVYLRQPEGFGSGSDRMCKLKRSLYGLKVLE